MKLLQFEIPGHDTGRRAGVLHEGRIVDITDLLAGLALPTEAAQALRVRGIEPAAGGLVRWLQAGPAARAALAPQIAQRLASPQAVRHDPAAVTLRAPVARPGKVVAIGRNYADHAKETGVQPFEKPRIISKLPSSVTDPGTVVRKPPPVTKFDFEGELGVVIGSFAHAVDEARALDHVAGYTLLNDLSAREFQFDISPAQTTFAKSMDGFCPLGPVLVSADAIPDPQALDLSTRVNGVEVQHATTADMLFPVRTLIAYISQYMTLEPGDVIATGTPAGIGAFRTPPVWLAAGDRIEVTIPQIGTLETRIG
ncbi:fumarylacetoacetate hydrolase family protein [Ramlibacter sp. MAHUQ-53]|uniref:fumarylacetoacetate hydrolase family protein n=1 Tax=unclassified Ramlibacter TaxID=2617605 RepID=UPI00362730C5